MLAFLINENLDSNKIIHGIQDLVSKEVKDTENYFLVIQIKKVNYTTNELIPKITYEPS